MSGQEWLLLVFLALLLFGGKRLPELARALGKSVQEFKKGMAGIQEEIDKPAEPSQKIEPPKSA